MTSPALCMVAGPNGSGKSTIIEKEAIEPKYTKVCLNADVQTRSAIRTGRFDLNEYDISIRSEEIISFFRNSTLLNKHPEMAEHVDEIRCEDAVIHLPEGARNSYFASVYIDLIRQNLLIKKKSFSLETVMSHESKTDFFSKAKSVGYTNHLYFISTRTPDINVERVRNRVALSSVNSFL